MEDPDSHLLLSAVACNHKQTPGQEVCWCKYPQALYPNWTPRQQKKAKLSSILDKRMALSTVHCLDVYQDGSFVNAGKSDVNQRTVDGFWRTIQQGVRTVIIRKSSCYLYLRSGPRTCICALYLSMVCLQM